MEQGLGAGGQESDRKMEIPTEFLLASPFWDLRGEGRGGLG